MRYELIARYDARQSFYKKAFVIETQENNKTIKELKSYNTIVAKITIEENKKIFEHFGTYSQTTTRHQKEFYKQEGLNDAEIKTLLKNNILEVK